MKKRLLIAMILLTAVLALGIGLHRRAENPDSAIQSTATAARTDAVRSAAPKKRSSETTTGIHSVYYLPGYDVETMLHYFDEVVLHAEYAAQADGDRVMRWETPIRYCLHGSYTQTDADWLAAVFAQLEAVPGFPAVRRVETETDANMNLYFCGRDEFRQRTYPLIDDPNANGSAIFHYQANGVIKEAEICYCSAMAPAIRKSVLTEEIFNAIGFANDSKERKTSVTYQYASTAEEPDDVDLAILRLLYAPEMQPGLDAEAAAAVIRKIYF